MGGADGTRVLTRDGAAVTPAFLATARHGGVQCEAGCAAHGGAHGDAQDMLQRWWRAPESRRSTPSTTQKAAESPEDEPKRTHQHGVVDGALANAGGRLAVLVPNAFQTVAVKNRCVWNYATTSRYRLGSTNNAP